MALQRALVLAVVGRAGMEGGETVATVYRRGRLWWGRFQRGGQEYRKPLKTAVESIARKRLNELIEEHDRVVWGGKPRHTFDDLALAFIDRHLPTLKPKSAKRYGVSLRAMTDHFEGMYLDEITSATLAEFVDKRRAGGVRIPENLIGKRAPKAISTAAIRRDLACLSSMFGCAIEWEWIEHNPVPAFMKARKKRGLREGQPRTRWLFPEEEVALLAATRHSDADPALYDAVCLAIDTGMRREELLSLRHEQVNLARNQIELSTGTKNSKAREIPLLPRSAQILGTVIPLHRSAFVLVNRATGRRYSDLGKGLAGAAKRAGIKRLTWHDLRRTCGCRLLQDRGLSMEQVSRWLGHSSVLVTERAYAFLTTEHLHAAIGSRTKTGTQRTD